VGRALLMSGFATLAGNLALLCAVHRSESAVLFSHTDLLPLTLPALALPSPALHRLREARREKSLDLLLLARDPASSAGFRVR